MDEKTTARFWAKVDRSAGTDGCWLWTSVQDRAGYGRFLLDGALVSAHRIAWRLANGPIQSGDHHGTQCVCHRCDVPACVNPSHLFIGTHVANMADMATKGRARWKAHPGEANGSAKLTDALVRSVVADLAAGLLQREVASKYGIGQMTVSNIATGKTWAHVTNKQENKT